jgi:hypothetical protein
MRRLAMPLLVMFPLACKKSQDPPPPSPKPTPTETETETGPTAGHGTNAGWTEASPSAALTDTLRREAARAIARNTQPYAYLHADWCEPCVAIANTRDDPKMRAAFAGTHIIGVDIDRVEPAQLEAAGLRGSVIPIFYRLDPQGRPNGPTIDGGAWGENVPDNMAPPLAAFFASGGAAPGSPRK